MDRFQLIDPDEAARVARASANQPQPHRRRVDSAAFVALLGAFIDNIVPSHHLAGIVVQIAREQANLTQQELADLMRVHRGVIARIETGRTKINSERRADFGHILGIPPDLLDTP